MIETTIILKDEDEWPEVDIKDLDGKVIAHRRRTIDELTAALNSSVQIPGLTNAWTMPIKTRIDMLATGIKTPVGIKVAGPDLRELERIAGQIEGIIRRAPGTSSVFAERVMGGNYVEFDIDRDEMARYGLTVGDVQEVLQVALGGMPLTTTVEGLERYGVILRYDRDYRENLEALRDILIPVKSGGGAAMGATAAGPNESGGFATQVPLSQLAKIRVVAAPMGIKSEAAIPNAWIYVDVQGVDIGNYVRGAQQTVSDAIQRGEISVPSRYSIFWSGQYEYMQRAKARLMIVVPFTLLIIIFIIYLNTPVLDQDVHRPPRGAVLARGRVLGGGSVRLQHERCGVGRHHRARRARCRDRCGDAALPRSGLRRLEETGRLKTTSDLRDAIYYGAVKRVRPKAMTAAVIIAGLLPILWSNGTGADTMKRIALPMVGGVVTSTLMELLVYPAIFFLWRSRKLPGPSATVGERQKETIALT